jgi:Mg-chelatase subunit ChlD
MERRISVRSMAAWLLGFCTLSCGSRTPLEIHPTDASDTVDAQDAQDAGRDVADASLDRPDFDVLQCIHDSRAVGEIPIDLYFALDRSKSMDTVDRDARVTRWEAISAAMNSFVNSPLSVGLGAGLEFFPRSMLGGDPYCASADYAFPVVPIGTLPGVAPSITKAISVQTRGQATPMTPALEGAHVYARKEQASRPTHTTAVVVVTDGMPRDCGSTLSATAAVAAAATTGIPPIRTYVLGVGPNLGNLNTIARAGGTSQAFLVESAGGDSLLAALEAIRTSAQSCEYVLPAGGQLPHIDDVQVSTFVSKGGVVSSVNQVPNAQACAGKSGWFFDRPIGGDTPPTKILLCPASCDPLVKGEGNRIDVAIGCDTP